ncbi:P-loop containing nucleoside triphosphate hydrolase protein [Phellopilus nigrolimitatus]|nr:P-loop containing nucleoside triphosphate hydrolase protein [Phellopilus nigrolimitatus]
MNAFLRTSHCLRANGRLHASPPSYRLVRRSVIRPSLRLVRHSSQTAAADATSSAPFQAEVRRPLGRVPLVRAFGFRELGIRDPIVHALPKAFPDVERPTLSQAEFIPAILNGKDVLLHDETGTGKSFGTILALLSKPRAKSASQAGRRQQSPCITSLVVVPHRDLGFQMMHWIESIVKHSEPHPPPLDSFAQLVVRGGSAPAGEQIDRLRAAPPHILIGTPQALWEIFETDRQALQVEDLATLVVDEVDYLLDIPPPYVRQSRHGAAWKNFNKHPSLARRLLEEILPLRKPGAVPLAQAEFDDKPKIRTTTTRPIQVVMSSATVHSNLTEHLMDARWMREDGIILSGKKLAKTNAHMILEDDKERTEVVHHAFVVSAGGHLANVEFAAKPGEEGKKSEKKQERQDEDRSSGYREKSTSQAQKVPPQSPTSAHIMEAVATFFALDVPRLALLVLPPNTSVQKALSELQDLGINARTLDLRSGEMGRMGRPAGQAEAEPTLLVATPATVRGVDLPELTHVFCVGAPDVASADVFKHVAGRVDRFGRGGKVITIMNEREQEYRDGMVRTTKNPAGLLRTFYRKLGIEPQWFDLSTMDLTVVE